MRVCEREGESVRKGGEVLPQSIADLGNKRGHSTKPSCGTAGGVLLR